MEKPGSSLLASIAVHAAVVLGVLGYGLLGFTRAPPEIVTAVPVQIISETLELGGTPAPVTPEVAPEPPVEPPPAAPPPPEPTPPARPPERTVVPPKKSPPTPRPPVTPPRPAEPSLDLGELSRQPNRPPPRTPPPRTGGGAPGPAAQTSGPQVTAMFEQVYQNWNPPCQTPGASDLRIQMDVTLSADGRIISGPTLVGRRSDPVWQAVADGAMQALARTAPFDVPSNFTGGSYRPSFNMQRACRGR